MCRAPGSRSRVHGVNAPGRASAATRDGDHDEPDQPNAEPRERRSRTARHRATRPRRRSLALTEAVAPAHEVRMLRRALRVRRAHRPHAGRSVGARVAKDRAHRRRRRVGRPRVRRTDRIPAAARVLRHRAPRARIELRGVLARSKNARVGARSGVTTRENEERENGRRHRGDFREAACDGSMGVGHEAPRCAARLGAARSDQHVAGQRLDRDGERLAVFACASSALSALRAHSPRGSERVNARASAGPGRRDHRAVRLGRGWSQELHGSMFRDDHSRATRRARSTARQRVRVPSAVPYART